MKRIDGGKVCHFRKGNLIQLFQFGLYLVAFVKRLLAHLNILRIVLPGTFSHDTCVRLLVIDVLSLDVLAVSGAGLVVFRAGLVVFRAGLVVPGAGLIGDVGSKTFKFLSFSDKVLLSSFELMLLETIRFVFGFF